MKEKFIQSTFILLIGGMLTKLLAMFIKIATARIIGSDGLGLYMLILPTFSLFIGIGQFGIPLALSKLVSENKNNNKKLYFSVIPIIIIINILLILFIIIISPIIAEKLLHNRDTYLSLVAIGLVIPFTSISSVCRSYFFGRQRMFPHIFSNIVENLIRLSFILLFLPKISLLPIKYSVLFLVLINIVSEISSTIILLCFLPKNINIEKSDLRPSRKAIHSVLELSIPNTVSRFISSVGYFLEPIIIMSCLTWQGYSNSLITREYGIITGYVLPLLLLPSFFTMAISQALLPIISNYYVHGEIKQIKRKLKQATSIIFLIGFSMLFTIELMPDFFLKILYDTTLGESYLRVLAPFFILQYLETPLSYTLHAMGKTIDDLEITIVCTIVKAITIFALSLLHIGLWSLILSIILSILIQVIYSISKVRKYLR